MGEKEHMRRETGASDILCYLILLYIPYRKSSAVREPISHGIGIFMRHAISIWDRLAAQTAFEAALTSAFQIIRWNPPTPDTASPAA